MPMDFPDLQSLEQAAEVWKFRARNENETEAQYREELADFVQSRDFVESMEIRKGKGWNRFNEQENMEMIRRRVSF